MKERIKKIWVKALQSGKYKKIKKRLRNKNGFCALGVLCDLYTKEHPKIRWEDGSILGEEGELPIEIRKWANLSCSDGNEVKYNGGRYSIIDLNDLTDLHFKTMAKIIEEQL